VINVAPIQTFYQKLPWKAEVLANLQSFFVDIFGGKVFSYATVIGVA